MTSAEWIEHEIKCLDLSETAPYSWWAPTLFRSIDSEIPEKVMGEERFVLTVGSTILWRDALRNMTIGCPAFADAIRRVLHLALFYACLVFPRERDIKPLRKLVRKKSHEERLLDWYSGNEYRHIRNAIAHGNIEFDQDAECKFINLEDRKWTKTVPIDRLILDCMILSEVFVVLFEKRWNID